MIATGRTVDEHGRPLKTVFEVELVDLVNEISPGTADPTDGVVIKDSATGTLFTVTVADFLSGGGAVTNGVNVGAGTGQVFKGLVGNDLQFRTLLGGGVLNIMTAADEVQLSVNVGAIDHSLLNNLAWSTSGHFIDTNFLPDAHQTHDLGSLTFNWRRLFIGGATTDGVFIRSNGAAASGASPLFQVIGETNAGPEIVMEQHVEWIAGSSEKYVFNLTGGEFLLNFAWEFTATPTDAFIAIKPHFRPFSDAVYDLGSTSRRWRNLFLSGGILDSASNQIYIRRSGVDALTGNWNAGAFEITAKKFNVVTTAISTQDNYLSQININSTSADTGTYKGIFVDIDHSQNGAGALHTEIIYGAHFDIDLTHTATLFSSPTAMFVKGTFDSAASVALSSRVFDLTATVNNTSYSGATSGAYSMQIIGATSNAITALKTDAQNSGSGRICGYQGAGTALTGATGELVGVEGFITSVNTVSRIIGVSSVPRAVGTPPASDKVLSFKGASGHLLITAASGALVTGTPSDLSTVSTTHLNFVSNTGELYVQGALEVDGKTWMDGDAELADAKNLTVGSTTGSKIGTATTQKLGFWNAAPVAQPSAFTQTYATASKTHANLTSATLTDSTGGTANTTCVAIAGTGDDANINNNFADIIAQVNALRVDIENAKQVLNAVIDDDQAIGIKS